MSKIRALSESERLRILALAEEYVTAKRGEPGAFGWFALVEYLKGLRKERMKGE